MDIQESKVDKAVGILVKIHRLGLPLPDEIPERVTNGLSKSELKELNKRWKNFREIDMG